MKKIKYLNKEKAEKIWEELFLEDYKEVDDTRFRDNLELKHSLIRRMWKYKNEDGERFSMARIGKLMNYVDHTTVKNYIDSRNIKR